MTDIEERLLVLENRTEGIIKSLTTLANKLEALKNESNSN